MRSKDKREWKVLQFLDREGVVKEEKSNSTEQTKHGQRSTDWKRQKIMLENEK